MYARTVVSQLLLICGRKSEKSTLRYFHYQLFYNRILRKRIRPQLQGALSTLLMLNNGPLRCRPNDSLPSATNGTAAASRPHEGAESLSHPTSVDEDEVVKFSAMAQSWWDESGDFIPLHTMNELRIPLVRDALKMQPCPYAVGSVATPLAGYRILDVGCGGGILSEPLARLGASVVGVDASVENIKIAQVHASFDPVVTHNVKYINSPAEDLLSTEAESFDAVVASEVIEHVTNKATFIETCCKLVKPGGSIILTTMNKTYLSYALGIVAAEQMLRMVPPGTHDWEKFLSPQDLEYLLDKHGCKTHLVHGLLCNPLNKRWSWITDTSVSYALHAVKQKPLPEGS